MTSSTGERSLARGAAVITLATALSRVTGFVRVVVVAGAMGTTFLANTYQTANTAPNVVFELVAAGVLTSIFVPTFVEYMVRGRQEEGWEAGNALASVALVGLALIALVLALAAPVVMRLLTIGVDDPALREREVELGATFLRLFAPQVAFYGAGMIMTGALHAHRRFALPAVAPLLNNLVVIAVYVTYAAMRAGRPPSVATITDAETLVLGIGTTLGVVAMTLCLVPSLVRMGWRFRFRFDLSHPAVRKGARLGAWALGYAGGYQAGLIVVLMLANQVEGGVAAYQWAYTFFYLPHALFAVPIFSVLFTAMSEHVARSEPAGLQEKLRDGLGMLVFVLAPVAVALLVLSGPIATLTLRYGAMTSEGATLVARCLGAFALGLPAYSIFLVFTRAFYAIGDTKTPAVVNAGAVATASVAGALLFALAPSGWEVPGLAAGHSLGFGAGAGVLASLFARRAGRVRSTHLMASTLRSTAAALVAGGVMAFASWFVPGSGLGPALVTIVAAGAAGSAVYGGLMWWTKSRELERVLVLVRGIRA
ncbi:MAG TPA: murein biosynthesis integral membrane protein MurJ [Actinomycetota bacterium]|nr:murein biosynthesis integral membrane protein MurJ [Actinomycetota bacterium]